VRASIAFVVTFLVCAGLGAASSGCFGCDCDSPDSLPPYEGGHVIVLARVQGATDEPNPSDVNPVGGTVEVTGSTLEIYYTQDDIDYHVSYTIREP